MASWLSRMFTIPASERARLNQDPLVHLAAQGLQMLAFNAASNVVDRYITNPTTADMMKNEIAQEIERMVPVPAVIMPAPTTASATTSSGPGGAFVQAPMTIVEPPQPDPLANPT